MLFTISSMKYKHRIIESKIRRYFESFSCVLLTGARQSGKSTLLQHLFGSHIKSFTFDPVQDLYGARADPELFLRNNPAPLILDEIQYAPELIPALKRYVDANRVPGLFLITGSQQWEVMRNLSESLAGRVAIIDLPAFSLSEQEEDDGLNWFSYWMENADSFPAAASARILRGTSFGLSPTRLIWQGCYPEVQNLSSDVIPGWMRGYISTYLQRDVRSLLAVKDETQFGAFLGLCAALTAQECNYSQMGRDIGLSTPAVQNWISALRGTFQWLEMPAFSRNPIKKLSQKPKGYLSDTGLACYLLRLASPEAVLGHPLFGALFETFVALDLMKQVQRLETLPAFHHFRLHSGAEVDLVAEINGKFLPIEIKAASKVKSGDVDGITRFQNLVGKQAGAGLIVYGGKEALRVSDSCLAVPFDLKLI